MESAITLDRSTAPNRFAPIARKYGQLAALGLLLCGLYLTARYSYLLFHSLVEVFRLVIGGGVFVIVWNSRQRLDNGFFLLLGIGLLCAGVVDLIHMLAYKGMGVFADRDANFPTQLWIAARYLQAAILFLATAFVRARCRALPALAACAAVTLLLLAAVWTGAFPDCYVEGSGLTPFKIASEYVISLLFAAAIANLLRQRSAFEADTLRAFVLCFGLSIAAELSFTAYASVFGVANMAGHLLRLAASFVVYVSIVRIGLQRPHDLLFRKLHQSEQALRESEESVRQLSDAAAEGIVFHERGLILDANEAFARLCGLEAGAELTGRHCLALLPLTPETQAQLGAAMLARNDSAGEIVCVWPGGARRVFETAHASVVYDGREARMLRLRDITERKQADETLHTHQTELKLQNEELQRVQLELGASQARYFDLYDLAPVGYFSVSAKGLILQANLNVTTQLCVARNTLVGQPISRFVLREDQDVFYTNRKQLLESGEARAFELRMVKLGGTLFWAHLAVSIAQGADGAPELRIALSDITKSKRVENEVRKLSRAVEQSPAAVMITDRTGNIEYVNPQFAEVTGYGNAEVLGHNPRILKSGQTSVQTYREIWRVISAGGKWRGELRNRRKSGELYWEDAAISGLRDESGQITHFIGVKTDITASKQAAEALREMRAREIGIGASIQRSLLGEVPKGIEGAQLAAYADPSQIMDGDFYTARRYRPDCFEVLVGDVMGKGLQAALLGAGIVTAYNRALADLLVTEAGAGSLPTPAEIVNAIHRALTPQLMALSSFVTLALYRFYLDAGTLIYVNAGHTPGLLTRGSGARPVAILGDNLPIGVMADEVYVQSSLAVGPGDSLLVFSDGITEARSREGEEFGLERLSDLIEAGSKADLPPATLLHALRGEQRRFTGGGPGADDLTALMVKLRSRRRVPRGGIGDRIDPFVFTLPWNLEGLGALRARITECVGNLPAEDADALILASFEAATNVIRYSRLLVGDATITCRITREGEAVAVELIYPSAVFTPPAEVQPDLSGESESGFGLFIIEQSVDSVEYTSLMPGIASIRMVKRASAVAA